MFWLQLRDRRFLIVGAAKDRGMGNFDGQNIITPNFPGIGNNSRGVGSGSAVHGKEDAEFLMSKRILIPHDTLYVVNQIGDTINSHAFSRSRDDNEVCGCKRIKGKHSFAWGRVNQDKIITWFEGIENLLKFKFIAWL